MDAETFAREDRKYSELWKDGYREANWKRLARAVLGSCTPNKNGQRTSLIDLGFGRGAALDFFEEKGFRVAGVDISSYAVLVQRPKKREVYQASLDDMRFLTDGCFDIGFANDTLEHIPEELIRASLAEAARICSEYLFVSVCPMPSHHLSLEGENLHLTVKPRKWWEEQLAALGRIERVPFLLSRSLRYAVELSK